MTKKASRTAKTARAKGARVTWDTLPPAAKGLIGQLPYGARGKAVRAIALCVEYERLGRLFGSPEECPNSRENSVKRISKYAAVEVKKERAAVVHSACMLIGELPTHLLPDVIGAMAKYAEPRVSEAEQYVTEQVRATSRTDNLGRTRQALLYSANLLIRTLPTDRLLGVIDAVARFVEAGSKEAELPEQKKTA